MTSITIKQYYAENGSRFSNKDAEIIGPVLVDLAEKGGVTARDVLDVARSKNNPLHTYFEWNNEKAADLFRLEQARNIMRSIRITYQDAEEKTHSSRIVQAVTTSAYSDKPRSYHSFKILHGDTLFAAQLLGASIDDLRSWKKKYEPYVDMWDKFSETLQIVVNQIGELEDEIKPSGAEARTDEALNQLIEWRRSHIETVVMWNECKEQVTYLLEAIAKAEETFAKVNTVKQRKCLTCESPFWSIGAGHRLCEKCTNRSNGLAEASVA